jgi:hypothetical protein
VDVTFSYKRPSQHFQRCDRGAELTASAPLLPLKSGDDLLMCLRKAMEDIIYAHHSQRVTIILRNAYVIEEQHVGTQIKVFSRDNEESS